MRAALLLGAALAAGATRPAAAQEDPRPQCTEQRHDTLEGRHCLFLHALGRSAVLAFLPGTGTFTYVHTTHGPSGATEGMWRFAAADAVRAARIGGPLQWVFHLNFEGQPIGRLSHQVMHRGTGWRRVRGDRFVPRDAPDDSPLFVQWRREGGTWVVAAVGDESFRDVPHPPWCC
ncbi:MAG TPA: hypothetical protein VE871_10935 [Longimicrobium sp.]|nr:hypothetical protein [Longimicrobium sp.]